MGHQSALGRLHPRSQDIRGIRLEDHPQIEFKKKSPELAEAYGLTVEDGKVICPVAMELPARIMGSGAELNAEFVDQDLMSGDRTLMAELGIDQMRLGDLIGIRDVDHRFGRSYREGWTAICICIHGDSVMTGHGPGILTLITGPADRLDFRIDAGANIAETLGITEGAVESRLFRAMRNLTEAQESPFSGVSQSEA